MLTLSCRGFLCGGLALLAGCATQNDEFEDAWKWTCYDTGFAHAVIGDPLPNAPRQIYTDKNWGNSMYRQYSPAAEKGLQDANSAPQ